MKVWMCKACTKPCILLTYSSNKPTDCPYNFTKPKWEEQSLVCVSVVTVGKPLEV